MSSGIISQFERVAERINKRVYEGAKVAWLKTRYANTKAEMDAFSKEMKKRIGDGIVNEKVPGRKFGDGEFWRRLASVIAVRNAVYNQSKGKRNFYFEVIVGPGTMPKNKVWNGATIWKVAWQKQIGGNTQYPSPGKKGIPIPTRINRKKRASTTENLRFVPRKKKVSGIIGYLVHDPSWKELDMRNETRKEFGGSRGSGTFGKKPIKMSTLRKMQPAMFVVYESYTHKTSPDPWMPTLGQLESYRKEAVRKAFKPKGFMRDRT